MVLVPVDNHDSGVYLTRDVSGGESYTYSLDNLSGIDNYEIVVTGRETTSPGSTSGVKSDGQTLSASVGGTETPTNVSATLTGKELTNNRTQSEYNVSAGSASSITVNGNVAPEGQSTTEPRLTISGDSPLTNPEMGYTNQQGSDGTGVLFEVGGNGKLAVQFAGYDSSDVCDNLELLSSDGTTSYETKPVSSSNDWVTFDRNVSTGEKYQIVSNGHATVGADYDTNLNLSGSAGTVLNGASADGSLSNYPRAIRNFKIIRSDDYPSVSFNDGTSSNFYNVSGSSDTRNVDISENASSLTINGFGNYDYTLETKERTHTENPSVSVNSTSGSYAGILTPGTTTSVTIDLVNGSNNISVSTIGDVGVDVDWTEITATVDPSIDVNGVVSSYTGKLAQGESVTIQTDESWINSGTNTISINGSNKFNIDYRHKANVWKSID